VRAGRLAQRQMTLKRQVTVRVVTIDSGPCGLQRRLGWPQVGIQVLQSQKPRISRGVSGIADRVHANPGNVTRPRNGHRSLTNQLDHCPARCADYRARSPGWAAGAVRRLTGSGVRAGIYVFKFRIHPAFPVLFLRAHHGPHLGELIVIRHVRLAARLVVGVSRRRYVVTHGQILLQEPRTDQTRSA
jgi:hypothetical protein